MYHQCNGNGVGVYQKCRSAVVHVTTFCFRASKWKFSKKEAISGELRIVDIRLLKIQKLINKKIYNFFSNKQIIVFITSGIFQIFFLGRERV